jgi:hypothetical protein
MDVIITSIFIICIVILVYAILKERQESGCSGFGIQRQCIEEESVHIKGTKMQPNDNIYDLCDRLKSITSYHKKGAVWRKCYILAIIMILFTYAVDYSYGVNNVSYIKYVILLIIYTAIIYFYHNFINYHNFRILKKNAQEIINKIKKKYGKIRQILI